MKNRLHFYFLIFFTGLSILSLTAQSSFQKAISNESTTSFGWRPEVFNENQLLFTAGIWKDLGTARNPIHTFTTDEQGNFLDSYIAYGDSSRHIFLFGQDILENHQVISFGRVALEELNPATPSSSGIYYLNREENNFWGRLTAPVDKGVNSQMLFTSTASILVSNKFHPTAFDTTNKFGIAKLDYSGNTIWNRAYILENQPFFENVNIQKIYEKSTSEYLCFGSARNDIDDERFFFMVNIDSNGTFNESKSFFREVSGNTYLVIVKDIQFDAAGNIYAAVISSEGSEKITAIVKLDSDFNFIWGRKIMAENLDRLKIKISTSGNGETTFAYISNGNFPTAIGNIDTNGNLLDYQGYSFFFPEISIVDDGSILFYTGYTTEDGVDLNEKRIIAETNPDKTFDNCSTYPVCLHLEEYDLQTELKSWSIIDIDPLEYVSVTVEDYPMELEDICYTPPTPTPSFLFSDTICLDACIKPDSLVNSNAHYQEWTITAPDDTDTLMLDKAPEYCFTQEGTYLIEQTIWFLGCDYSYEQTVEVVPAMNINLGNDGINCNTLPYELTLQSNRPIMSYEWSDGSTNPTLMLTESGTYWVAARGPYCESVERDTITIEFIEDYVDLPLFSLPNDTSICIQHYPYTIAPQSSSPLSYTLNGTTKAAPSHAITQAGSYVFATTVEGCVFQDTINIITNDCQASIYLPNAFSPNFDGINDDLYPQGVDFETIRLEVFDRWGGLVSQSTGATASWDGVGASVGVYVIQLTYRNLLSNEVEVLVRDVVVLR